MSDKPIPDAFEEWWLLNGPSEGNVNFRNNHLMITLLKNIYGIVGIVGMQDK